MNLQLKNISLPLANFDLEVDIEVRSRVTAIFGPSGAGKTSLLDLVAGLRKAKSALIRLDDKTLTNTVTGVMLPPRHRRIGYVPQDLALFPHLSVKQNLLYGCRQNSLPDPRFSFDHIVDVLEIQSLISRSVTDLSGGEKQRVALARALLASPHLLALDEPLASLDAPLKAKVMPYLTRVRDEFQIPMLYVTHHRDEALTLADEVIILERGKVLHQGSAMDVFNRPPNAEVARIVGLG